jgi:Uma2 family endonuclease
MHVDLEPPFLLIKPGVREEEFYRLAGEDSDWEYVDGRLVMSPASDLHERIFGFFISLLWPFLAERGGGVVRGSRYPMRLDERWSLEPDLLVVRAENLHRMTPKRLEGPADWVLEIASDGDPGFDEREKLPRYHAAGIPEIWWVDPFRQTLRIDTREETRYTSRTLTAGQAASRILEGFWIETAWLWEERPPSPLACLQRILGLSR